MAPMRISLYVASVAGLAMLTRAVLVGPPPVWLAVTMLVGYVALSAFGWLLPTWQMYGDTFCRGSRREPLVALTFDDGPSPTTTPRVLDALAKYRLVATFCVIGAKAERHPDLMRRIVREGHAVALHGYQHRRLYSWQSPLTIAKDIETCRSVVADLTGVRPHWFRPPIGHVSPRVAAGARRTGVGILGFSLRGFDGLRGARPHQVLRRLRRGLRPGVIVALHDASEREEFVPAGIEVLPELARLIRERNLRSVTVDELWATLVSEQD